MKPLLEDCSCANEVSADFLMEEAYAYNNDIQRRFTATDSILGDKIVRFRAVENNAEYTWYVGQEIVEGSSEVVRNFPSNFVGQSLPITLVVRKKPNAMCFPNDDGYDSITKYITVAMNLLNYYNRTDVPLSGNFRMKSPTMVDSIDISTTFYSSVSGGLRYFIIRNIPNYHGYDSLYTHVAPKNYRQYWEQIGQYMVDFHHRLDGKVILKMENLISGRPSQYFEGRKL